MPHNLFLAARPAPDEANAIAELAGELRRTHDLVGALLKPENLHVTLVEFSPVKEAEAAVMEKILAAARQVAFAPFDVMFDRAMSFSRAKNDFPLVLGGSEGAEGLVRLQRSLIQALHKQWLKIPPNPGYTPHMTLLYADAKIEATAIAPIRWRVEEFLLIRSLPGKSTHLVLDRWPLLG